MKKGVFFWLTFTLSLLAMTALTGTSSQSIKVLPGPVEVKQGNNVTLWCKLEGDPNKRPPVTWQSPPDFQTRTSDCTSYSKKKKYLISCAGSRWYNMTIVDVQWSDNGKYRCISNIYKIVDLQVLVPVTVVKLTRIPHGEEELLLLGKNSKAALTCTTNCAYPASSISWFENDQPFNGSAGVALTECTGEKTGQKQSISMVTINGKDDGEDRTQSDISCTAGNVEGEPKVSKMVDVRYNVPVSSVTLTHIPRSKEKLLQLGKDGFAVLTCATNCAYPAPNISWFKNGQHFNDSVEATITECTGEKKGQKKTTSMVTVNGEYMDVERNQSIACRAGNVEGEQKVSKMVNVKFNAIPKQPQPVMTPSDNVATIVVPVFVIIVLIISIGIGVHMYREKKKKKDAIELIPLLQCGGGCRIIYAYDDTKATDEEGKTFLGALRKGLQKHGFKVELRKVKRSRGKLVSKVLEEELESKSNKVILSFPEDKFGEDELHKTFKEIMQGGDQPFVAVIILTEAFMALPSELQGIEKIWIDMDRKTQGFKRAIYHLHFLQDETTKQVDVTLMNLGTGLAWSYYLGYLRFLLKVFKETILTSSWQNENRDILEKEKLSKRIHIVFSTDCQEPKIMKSERIKLKRNIKYPTDRAGLKRDYVLAIQEVQSKDKKESCYGVVCFLNVVQCLSEMKDDPNKGFFLCDKDDVRTHGQDCFEKLKLLIKYNEKVKKDQSKFDFIKFNAEAKNANENDLADELFNRMKETCSSETSCPIQVAPTTDAYQTGVLSELMSEDVKNFVVKLENSINITNRPRVHDQSEFGLNIIRESKRIFMVLTDELVQSEAFAKWFYKILDKGFQMNDKRFLVCLNCLKENAKYPKVLELEQLFDCVYYTERFKWADMVKTELEGAVEEIRYDHLSHNIGTGLAMSWYYKFLKIKIPKVRDVIEKCPVLWEKFQEGRMSHKVFILFPSSCRCPEELPCVDIIQEVGSKKINLPHIKKDNRDYTPKVYKLDDDGEEYYAFFEYSTPADTMYKLMHEGFLKMPEKILQEEWERFRTTLHTLINHKYEPMDIKNRVFFIPYDDAKLKEQHLEFKLLDHVKDQIPPKSERKLPTFIDNGATVEETGSSVTTAATDGDIGASGGLAEADVTANTNTIGV